MAEPCVSVIMPAHNNAPYIGLAIESVLNQSHKNWELLIVDDASSDGTLEAAEAHQAEDSRIKVFVMAENQGAAFCRNFATKKSKGDYIAFLDADDLWFPEKLERQLSFMKARDLAVSYTAYEHIDLNGHKLGCTVRAKSELTQNEQKTNNFIGNLTGMYTVSKLGRLMAPEMRKRQDWALWHKAILSSGIPAQGLDQVLAAYRISPQSMSAKKLGLIRHNFAFYRQYLGYTWLKSCLWMAVFFVTYFTQRKRLIRRSN
jgi:teichuronic acid biosynthesis glycosyltransferase TuaG